MRQMRGCQCRSAPVFSKGMRHDRQTGLAWAGKGCSVASRSYAQSRVETLDHKWWTFAAARVTEKSSLSLSGEIGNSRVWQRTVRCPTNFHSDTSTLHLAEGQDSCILGWAIAIKALGTWNFKHNTEGQTIGAKTTNFSSFTLSHQTPSMAKGARATHQTISPSTYK